MGFLGFTMPDGSVLSAEEALLAAESAEFPYPAWMIAGMVPGGVGEDYDEKRESYSPSSLSGCKRQIALRRRFDYALDPSKEWAKMRGTGFHLLAEGSWKPDYVQRELKLSRNLDLGGGRVVEVRGKVDEYNARTRHLADVKTVKFISDYLANNAKPEWSALLSVYRWLLAPERVVDTAEIVMLDMMSTRRRPYRLWSLEKVEEWMKARAEILWRVYHEDYVPPVIPVRERWRCPNCPMLEHCRAWAASHGEEGPDEE